MHPIFWEINQYVVIRWYGVMVALGFLAAMFLIDYNRRYAAMSRDQATTLVFVGVIAGVIGSRIAYVVQFFDHYRNNWFEMVRIDRGGLVFYGGFFMALFCMAFYCRRAKLDIWRVFDVCTPALAIGHMFGRIGCFLNGCCFGKPTTLYWGVVHPERSIPAQTYGDTPLHPVQLYEALANLILAVLMFYVLRRTWRGIPTASYLLIYGLLRFADEFFRGDHADSWVVGLSRAQTVGLLLVPVGIISLIYFIKNGNKNTKTDSKSGLPRQTPG